MPSGPAKTSSNASRYGVSNPCQKLGDDVLHHGLHVCLVDQRCEMAIQRPSWRVALFLGAGILINSVPSSSSLPAAAAYSVVTRSSSLRGRRWRDANLLASTSTLAVFRHHQPAVFARLGYIAFRHTEQAGETLPGCSAGSCGKYLGEFVGEMRNWSCPRSAGPAVFDITAGQQTRLM